MLKQDLTPDWLRPIIALCTGTQNPPDNANTPADDTDRRVAVPAIDRITLEHGFDKPDVVCSDTATLPSLGEMRHIFSTTCRQRVESIFAMAKLCHFTKSSYPRPEQLQIIDGVMDRPKFDKLAKVATDERLLSIEQLLPSSETTIILLSNFTDPELAAACRAGIIHPAASRRALAEWRRDQRYRAAHRDADQQPMQPYVVIWRDPNAAPESTEALKRLIAEVKTLAGVDVTYPRVRAAANPL